MTRRLESLASETLVDRLSKKQLPASLNGSLVNTGIADVRLSCYVENFERNDNQEFISTVSFRAMGDASPSVTASANGIGESEEDAVVDAVETYLEHVFPVFCAAIGEQPEFEPIDTARLTSLCDGHFINWDVYLGPYKIFGSRRDALLGEIRKQLPISLCMDSIAGYLNERRVHWVELRLSRKDEDVSGFVNIDNQNDPSALSALVEFEWPGQGNGAESFSQFIMLCPSDREVDKSTQSDLEEIRASVVNVEELLEEILSCEDFGKIPQETLEHDLNILTRLLEKVDGTSPIYKARAAIHGALGDLKSAVDDLTRAIELSQDDLDAYYRRSLVYVDTGNFEAAEKDLETASKLHPDDPRVLWSYAVFHIATEKYEKAKEELDQLAKAVEKESDKDYILYYRAVCSHHLNDFESALRDLTKVIEINPSYLDAYFERGHLWSHLGAHEKALSDYSRLLLMAPDRPEYLEARAWEYDKLGDFGAALEELRKVETLDPERATLYELRSRIFYKQKRYDEAIESAGRAIELLPSFAAAYDVRGESYEKIKKKKLAKSDFEKADEYWLKGDQPSRCPEVDWKDTESIKRVNLNQISLVDPTESLARRGALYQDLGLHEKAIEQFGKGLKREPRNPLLLQVRAASYEALGEWDKALEDATAVLSIEPEEAGHFYNRGAIYTQKGELDLAIQDFRFALEVDPEHAQSFAGAGYAYMAREDFESALIEYNRALELMPAEPDWLLSKAWCLQALYRYDAAVECLDEALAINESFADAYYCRGFVKSRLKKRQEALDDFNTAIDHVSDCSDYFASRGWEYFQLRDFDKAEADCRKAIEIDESDPAPYDTLCRMRLMDGKIEEAIELAQTCVQKAPDYPDIHDALSRIYEKLGKVDEAEEERIIAISLGYVREDED